MLGGQQYSTVLYRTRLHCIHGVRGRRRAVTGGKWENQGKKSLMLTIDLPAGERRGALDGDETTTGVDVGA